MKSSPFLNVMASLAALVCWSLVFCVCVNNNAAYAAGERDDYGRLIHGSGDGENISVDPVVQNAFEKAKAKLAERTAKQKAEQQAEQAEWQAEKEKRERLSRTAKTVKIGASEKPIKLIPEAKDDSTRALTESELMMLFIKAEGSTGAQIRIKAILDAGRPLTTNDQMVILNQVSYEKALKLYEETYE